MKSESAIRQEVRKVQEHLARGDVGPQERAACIAMIGALKWVTNKRDASPPTSYAWDAYIEESGVLNEQPTTEN